MENLPLDIFAIYFSPHSAHAIEIDGTIFPTLEHAYQSAKYNDHKIKEEIRNARSPLLAWTVSKKYKEFSDPEFDTRKLEIMRSLMVLKLEQHEDVRRALQESGESRIIKHVTNYPPADGFWDDGKDGKGLNHIGVIWMELRKNMR